MRHATPLLLLLAMPLMAHAQEPLRFLYRTEGMGSGRAAGGSGMTPISIETSRRRTDGIVILSARDSSGLKIWEITVDSARSSYIDTNPGSSLRGNVTTGNAVARQIHQVIFRGNRPIISATVGRPDSLTVRLDSLQPMVHLHTRLPGLNLLLPNPSLPMRPGEVRADTQFSHTMTAERTLIPTASSGSRGNTPLKVPASELFDTTIVTWTRVSVDSIRGTFWQTGTRQSGGGLTHRANGGNYLLVFDSENVIRQVAARVESNPFLFADIKKNTIVMPPTVSLFTLVRSP
jgi:hypothetical protein